MTVCLKPLSNDGRQILSSLVIIKSLWIMWKVVKFDSSSYLNHFLISLQLIASPLLIGGNRMPNDNAYSGKYLMPSREITGQYVNGRISKKRSASGCPLEVLQKLTSLRPAAPSSSTTRSHVPASTDTPM